MPTPLYISAWFWSAMPIPTAIEYYDQPTVLACLTGQETTNPIIPVVPGTRPLPWKPQHEDAIYIPLSLGEASAMFGDGEVWESINRSKAAVSATPDPAARPIAEPDDPFGDFPEFYWKPVSLSEGTRLYCSAHWHQYPDADAPCAEVRAGKLWYRGGRVASANEFMLAGLRDMRPKGAALGHYNAWHYLFVQRPGSDKLILANDLRSPYGAPAKRKTRSSVGD